MSEISDEYLKKLAITSIDSNPLFGFINRNIRLYRITLEIPIEAKKAKKATTTETTVTDKTQINHIVFAIIYSCLTDDTKQKIMTVTGTVNIQNINIIDDSTKEFLKDTHNIDIRVNGTIPFNDPGVKESLRQFLHKRDILVSIKNDLNNHDSVKINDDIKRYMDNSTVIMNQDYRTHFNTHIEAKNLNIIKNFIVQKMSTEHGLRGGKGLRKKRRRKTNKRNVRKSQRKSRKGKRKRKLRRQTK